VKTLVGIVVYDRAQNIGRWLQAWPVLERPDTKLLIVENIGGRRNRNPDVQKLVRAAGAKVDYYWERAEDGQDVGAFRDVLRADERFGDWEVLVWCTDDNIPINRGVIPAFQKPFADDPQMGLVGTYWVRGDWYWQYKYPLPIPDHFRTSSFAIRREAAMKLKFPKQLACKFDCYKFEWADPKHNLTQQMRDLGYHMQPLSGDWEQDWSDATQYIWDCGCLHHGAGDTRLRKNLWPEYSRMVAA
jgi:hypothetical protein